MNQEDIIRMAREAGMEQDGNNFFSPMGEEMDVHISNLERFFHAAYAAGAAAKRDWQGLTPRERIMCRSYDPEETVAKTEAKLKEKNT